jgi:hypothetical protein
MASATDSPARIRFIRPLPNIEGSVGDGVHDAARPRLYDNDA